MQLQARSVPSLAAVSSGVSLAWYGTDGRYAGGCQCVTDAITTLSPGTAAGRQAGCVETMHASKQATFCGVVVAAAAAVRDSMRIGRCVANRVTMDHVKAARFQHHLPMRPAHIGAFALCFFGMDLYCSRTDIGCTCRVKRVRACVDRRANSPLCDLLGLPACCTVRWPFSSHT